MQFTTVGEDGASIDFECDDSLASRWTCETILGGMTYPYLPFVDDVHVIFDVGANCGATSVHLARHYRGVPVHAFEPGRAPHAILERNAARWPDIHVHPVGLAAKDEVVPFYQSEDIGMGSVLARDGNVDAGETVELHDAGTWAAEHGVDRIDILKVDVEGCEIQVLESLQALLPTVKILYVEYDTRDARLDIERLLAPNHYLYTANLFLDQGECVFVRKDYAALDAARAYIADIVRARWIAPGGATSG